MMPRKIAVADDAEVSRVSVSALIRAYFEDVDIDLYPSGNDLVAAFEKGKYSFVLTDLRMPPGLDGFEVTQRIREVDQEVPVYIMSADREPESIQQAMTLGATGFLYKGLVNRELEPILKKVLG